MKKTLFNPWKSISTGCFAARVWVIFLKIPPMKQRIWHKIFDVFPINCRNVPLARGASFMNHMAPKANDVDGLNEIDLDSLHLLVSTTIKPCHSTPLERRAPNKNYA